MQLRSCVLRSRRSVVVAAILMSGAAWLTPVAFPTTSAAAAPPAGAAQPDSYVPVGPVRLLDTRSSAALAPGASRTIGVAGAAVLPPSTLVAATVNLTAVSPAGVGYVTARASGGSATTTSSLNFTRGRTVANQAVVAVGDDGAIVVTNRSSAPLHLLVDLVGVTTSAAAVNGYQTVGPRRVLDTRVSAPVAAGRPARSASPQRSGGPRRRSSPRPPTSR